MGKFFCKIWGKLSAKTVGKDFVSWSTDNVKTRKAGFYMMWTRGNVKSSKARVCNVRPYAIQMGSENNLLTM